jgi:hypothetical protein
LLQLHEEPLKVGTRADRGEVFALFQLGLLTGILEQARGLGLSQKLDRPAAVPVGQFRILKPVLSRSVCDTMAGNRVRRADRVAVR